MDGDAILTLNFNDEMNLAKKKPIAEVNSGEQEIQLQMYCLIISR